MNIYVGLTDWRGREVDSIQVGPNSSYGGRKVKRFGGFNTRLIHLKTVIVEKPNKKRAPEDPLRRVVRQARKEANEQR